MANKDKLIIDVDTAIDVHNEKNPNARISRKDLADKLGVTYQSLTNYQGGRIPDIVGKLHQIISITGVSFEELVKHKQ